MSPYCCNQTSTSWSILNILRIPIQNREQLLLEVFKDLNSKFLRPFCQTPGGQNLAIFESASGQLAQASRGSQLALETLRRSHLPSPLFPFTSSRPKLAGEPRKSSRSSPLGLPTESLSPSLSWRAGSLSRFPAAQDHPPATLPFPPLYPRPPCSAAPGHLPYPPLWPIKGHHSWLKRSTPFLATSQTSSSPF
jgi:hypothetical protein